MKIDYSLWNQQELIKRIELLERRIELLESHRHAINEIFQHQA